VRSDLGLKGSQGLVSAPQNVVENVSRTVQRSRKEAVKPGAKVQISKTTSSRT
jgi:hypothetical protein